MSMTLISANLDSLPSCLMSYLCMNDDESKIMNHSCSR